MKTHDETYKNSALNAIRFFSGLVVGGLVGSATMILFAPQSGKRTRLQIRQKSGELKTQVTDAIEDLLVETRHGARRIGAKVHDKAETLQQRGQEVLDDGKERLSTLVESGKTAVQNARS